MIRLTFSERPANLTMELANELTQRYILTKESVWNKTFIRKELLNMSSNKCCYCECKLDEESKYLEVEHFKPKSLYPDLVIEWENLLPSCKHCNGAKNDLDTDVVAIVHPCNDDPREHLYLKNYRLYPRNASIRGANLIAQVDLNNRQRLCNVRL